MEIQDFTGCYCHDICTLMEAINDLKMSTIPAKDLFPTVRGPLTNNQDQAVVSGAYEFKIARNSTFDVDAMPVVNGGTSPDNDNRASFLIRRVADSTPTPCTISWKSSWGGTSQEQVSAPVNIGPDWICVDGDLGYGSSPARGGAHEIVFMDNTDQRTWKITSIISGNADNSADFCNIVINAAGAQ